MGGRKLEKVACGADCLYPQSMRSEEERRIDVRRAAAGLPPLAEVPRIGVAVSGGGIRSATFALGFFQSLARLKLVRRIDDLSTVSGGGYFGAFLGRLFGRDYVVPPSESATERPVDRVEQALAAECGEFRYERKDAAPDSRSRITTIRKAGAIGQLRDNGHYLAPKGNADLILFGATLLRNFLLLQGIVLATLTALLLFPRLADATMALLHQPSMEHFLPPIFGPLDDGFIGPRLSTADDAANVLRFAFNDSPVLLWLLCGVLVLGVMPCLFGYWVIASRRPTNAVGRTLVRIDGSIPLFLLLCSAVLVPLGLLRPQEPDLQSLLLRAAPGASGLLALVAAWLVRRSVESRPDVKQTAVYRCRALLTRRLTTALIVAATLLLLCGVDLLGAWLQREGVVSGLKQIGALLAGGTVLAGFGKRLVVVLGGGLGGARPAWWSTALAWTAALAWALVLLVSADVIARALAAGAARTVVDAVRVLRPAAEFHLDRLMTAAFAGILGVTVLGVLLGWLLGRQHRLVNLSGQNSIYAARLTRAYLGASNPARIYKRVLMSDAIDSDDATVAEYWRHDRGAPLHYINTTVNETVDDSSGVQSLDRQGLPLVLGPAGLSAGKKHHYLTDWSTHDDVGEPGTPPVDRSLAPRHPRPSEADEAAGHDATKVAAQRPFVVFADGFLPEWLTIGNWVSISGAAFSTGLGSRTTLGMSLLCGLSNVRLGWWYDTNIPATERGGSKLLSWLDRHFMVQTYLTRELLARFHGINRRHWYLSDGGHFENMGGYELIRRRVRHIVVVDGECDPDTTFEGIGQLVRLARVDFDTEIRFCGEAELDGLVAPEQRRFFGSLDHLRRGRWEGVGEPGDEEAGRKDATLDEARADGHSLAHAALAIVRYPDGSVGQLIYVKTTLLGDETVDLAHYHAAHPDFPHETTADQFFDESQWESYRKLGELIGERLFAPGWRPLYGTVVQSSRAGTWSPADLLHGRLAGEERAAEATAAIAPAPVVEPVEGAAERAAEA
ncbi:MAG: hypothetical protein JNL90_00585 [Planctomycetes bacterium]|nr:hypothetical protein [Planctomycetota bacterium]